MGIILIVFLALIVGIVIGGAVVMGLREDRKQGRAAEKIGKGLDERNKAMQAEKETKKKQILEMLALRQAQGLRQIANNDVEKALKISDATATRYLDELEAEGKIQAVGESARGTRYRLR